MSSLAIPNLPVHIRVSEDALAIEDGIGFNVWRDSVEGLREAQSATQWWLGDWWLAGQRLFGMDYIPALEQIKVKHPTVVMYARVARAFPPRPVSDGLRSEAPPIVAHRELGVSFDHHRICAGIADEEIRMGWVRDVLRQSWSTRQLEAELAAWVAGGRPEQVRARSLAIRASGDVAARCQARADALGVDVKELALAVLDLASQLDDPIATLEAAGARLELEAA